MFPSLVKVTRLVSAKMLHICKPCCLRKHISSYEESKEESYICTGSFIFTCWSLPMDGVSIRRL